MPNRARAFITSKAWDSNRWAILLIQFWKIDQHFWVVIPFGSLSILLDGWNTPTRREWNDTVSPQKVKVPMGSASCESTRESQPCALLPVGSWPLLQAGCKDCELEDTHLISSSSLCPFPSKVMCCASPWLRRPPPTLLLEKSLAKPLRTSLWLRGQLWG